MKSKLGILFTIIGVVLLLGAASLYSYNQYEQMKAAESVESLMPKLAEKISENMARETEVVFEESVTAETVAEELKREELPVVEIDGNGYIGVVSIGSLSLELPVMADWSNEKLNIAPCVYSGDMNNDDLVIMAHNYTKHFGMISELNENDTVKFTDMNGNTTSYRVVVTDVLSEMDIEDMTAGEYDLTLFTCNYDGKSRITIRCERV
ncbi:MAG: sortase [Clostridia bacterium]|nr:sortase [Clostridia bacterium]